jgi:hypothetical protein
MHFHSNPQPSIEIEQFTPKGLSLFSMLRVVVVIAIAPKFVHRRVFRTFTIGIGFASGAFGSMLLLSALLAVEESIAAPPAE